MPPSVNIADRIDNSPLGPLQVSTFALCLLCLIMDGFDVQALGYVAPEIVREWKIQSAALGPVFGATNFGVLVGSLVFSMLADTIGRRPILVGATLFFGVMMLAAARAASVGELLALRFVAGIGLGCIIPNATALIGEYSPRRLRGQLMMVIGGVGFTGGAAIAGFISAFLIPRFGWRSVLYFGGAVPLLIALAMLVWLPESLQFLVVRRKDRAKIARWLMRIDPTVPSGPDVEFVVSETGREGVPVVHLFREGRAAVTILLWVVNFMNLLNLYFLASWLPTVVRDAGRSASTGVLAGTILQVGGTIGTVGLAWLIGRLGFMPVLTASFAVASVTIALIGQPGLSIALLFVLVFIAGWCVVGGQPGINALAGTFYPTSLRSTGVGWGLGIGRAGAIVGPVVGGEFLRRQWSTRDIFLAAAVPAFISTVALLGLRVAMARRSLRDSDS
ncbi:MAG TPA: MFS transporter [Vicinamibacterales bacterium]|jgi:AAHS family 4-hydroxybenzoate transporter-like MFS transporter